MNGHTLDNTKATHIVAFEIIGEICTWGWLTLTLSVTRQERIWDLDPRQLMKDLKNPPA